MARRSGGPSVVRGEPNVVMLSAVDDPPEPSMAAVHSPEEPSMTAALGPGDRLWGDIGSVTVNTIVKTANSNFSLYTTYNSNHFLITREYLVIFSPYTEDHISLRQESLILCNKRLAFY